MKQLISVITIGMQVMSNTLARVPRAILMLLFVAGLALNVATLTISGLYTVASGALSAIGISTVAAREAGEKLEQRRVTQKIGRETAKKVSRRVQIGAARNITSVAGEAIPFVGIAVIAGALSLEVKDACDTAADMAGLEAALAAETDPATASQDAVEAFDCAAMIREKLPDYEDLPSKEDLWVSVRNAPKQAYEAARQAGISLTDVDWSGKAWSALDQGQSVLEDGISWFLGDTEPTE